jgi:RNA polymerase sigma-70 factor, ECF subfamily
VERKASEFNKYWLDVQAYVIGYIRLFINNEADMKDVLQETAIIAFKKFDKYDKNKPFSNWVIGIARYEILSKRKKYAKNKIFYYGELIETISDVYVEMADEISNKVNVLRKCIKQLDEKSHKLLKLRYSQSLRIKKIAERWNLKPVTIRVRLNRLRTSLKTCINKHLSS